MADSIEILASAAHGNAATEQRDKSVTVKLVDWPQMRVEYQAKSTPVDVSGYIQLALDLVVQPPTSVHGWEAVDQHGTRLHVTLEHRRTGGDWEVLHRFEPVAHGGRQRAFVVGVHDEVRCSFFFGRQSAQETLFHDAVSYVWGLTAEALPEAAA